MRIPAAMSVLVHITAAVLPMLMSSSSIAQGEEDTVVVELKSGKTVRGTIVESTEEYLVIDQGGTKGPFYDPRRRIEKTEIKSIQSAADWDSARKLSGPPYWRWSTATGYAALGGIGLGALLAAGSATPEAAGGALAGALVGTLLGAGSGWAIGSSADRKIAAGEALGPGHRNAVRAGTMFIGGGIGLLVGTIRISDEGDSGRDEEMLLTSTAVGLAAGVLIQVLLDSKLRSTPLEPTIGVAGNEAMVVLSLSLGEPGREDLPSWRRHELIR